MLQAVLKQEHPTSVFNIRHELKNFLSFSERLAGVPGNLEFLEPNFHSTYKPTKYTVQVKSKVNC